MKVYYETAAQPDGTHRILKIQWDRHLLDEVWSTQLAYSELSIDEVPAHAELCQNLSHDWSKLNAAGVRRFHVDADLDLFEVPDWEEGARDA